MKPITFIKYTFSSVSSLLIDLLLFSLFCKILNNIFLATLIARTISSLYNFFVNAKIVFKKMSKTSILKYYTLVIIQMFTSAFFVTLFSKFILINPVIIKTFVDFIIFIINYFVQKIWVFKNQYK